MKQAMKQSDVMGSPEDYPPSADIDMVNNPPHYKKNGIECIEAIKAALTTEEFRGYCKGNTLKYTWRERYKGKPVEDLRKARFYLDRLILELENEQEDKS